MPSAAGAFRGTHALEPCRDAAVAELELQQARSRAAHAQPLRVGREQPAENRLCDTLVGLTAEAPDDEVPQTLVVSLAASRRQEALGGDAQLSERRKQRRLE